MRLILLSFIISLINALRMNKDKQAPSINSFNGVFVGFPQNLPLNTAKNGTDLSQFTWVMGNLNFTYFESREVIMNLIK